jgi:hypothetical protein
VRLPAVCLAVFAAMIAVASATAVVSPRIVSGAGSSSYSGSVVVHARATGPQVDDDVVPAMGFIHVKNSVFGDLTGKVACIGTNLPDLQRNAISGILDTPVSFDGQTYSAFRFLIPADGGAGTIVRLYLTNNAPTQFDCGLSQYFDNWWDGGPAGGEPTDFTPFRLTSGHFSIH